MGSVRSMVARSIRNQWGQSKLIFQSTSAILHLSIYSDPIDYHWVANFNQVPGIIASPKGYSFYGPNVPSINGVGP